MNNSRLEYFAAYRAKNRHRLRLKGKAYHAANKERRNAALVAARTANPELWRERDRKQRLRNKEQIAKQRAAWLTSNPERRREIRNRYATSNKAKIAQKSMRRYASQRNAAPTWANQFFIDEIYELARLRTMHLGILHEVDHIVPLVSKKVCGLHVEHNLRVIAADANRRKSNKHWPDMADEAT